MEALLEEMEASPQEVETSPQETARDLLKKPISYREIQHVLDYVQSEINFSRRPLEPKTFAELFNGDDKDTIIMSNKREILHYCQHCFPLDYKSNDYRFKQSFSGRNKDIYKNTLAILLQQIWFPEKPSPECPFLNDLRMDKIITRMIIILQEAVKQRRAETSHDPIASDGAPYLIAELSARLENVELQVYTNTEEIQGLKETTEYTDNRRKYPRTSDALVEHVPIMTEVEHVPIMTEVEQRVFENDDTVSEVTTSTSMSFISAKNKLQELVVQKLRECTTEYKWEESARHGHKATVTVKQRMSSPNSGAILGVPLPMTCEGEWRPKKKQSEADAARQMVIELNEYLRDDSPIDTNFLSDTDDIFSDWPSIGSTAEDKSVASASSASSSAGRVKAIYLEKFKQSFGVGVSFAHIESRSNDGRSLFKAVPLLAVKCTGQPANNKQDAKTSAAITLADDLRSRFGPQWSVPEGKDPKSHIHEVLAKDGLSPPKYDFDGQGPFTCTAEVTLRCERNYPELFFTKKKEAEAYALQSLFENLQQMRSSTV